MNQRSRRRRRRRREPLYSLKRKWRSLSRKISESFHRFIKMLKRAFPPRRPDTPIWKSRRFLVGTAGGVLCIVLILVIIFSCGKDLTEDSQKKIPVSTNTIATTVSPTPTEQPFDFYNGCDDHAKIAKLQERLVEIGYMDADEFTEHFGRTTETAVKRFELLNGVAEPTGHVDNALWEKIFSQDFAEYILQIGMEGDDIQELQERLRDLGYLSSSPTGYYGTDTEAALKTFQEKHGLTVSGKIDDATSEKLYSDDVISLYYKKGDKSDEIKTLQARLKELGYITFEPDGEYGNATYAAVKQFQTKNDLVVDGYMGYATKELLLSDNAKKNIISKGDEGEAVTKLQNRLVKLGYIDKATGYYGTDTVTAVKNFQKLNGLDVDGTAGAKTLSKLNSSDAVKAKKKVIVGQSSKVNQFIAAAKSKLGCKYVLGAKGPNKFDCSGLVYWCLNQAGVKQSYVTSVTWRKTGNYKTIKNINDVKAGDVICFSPHHVGIAISSTTMIDASTSNGKVVQRSFKTAYWRKCFVCARRIFS